MKRLMPHAIKDDDKSPIIDALDDTVSRYIVKCFNYPSR